MLPWTLPSSARLPTGPTAGSLVASSVSLVWPPGRGRIEERHAHTRIDPGDRDARVQHRDGRYAFRPEPEVHVPEARVGKARREGGEGLVARVLAVEVLLGRDRDEAEGLQVVDAAPVNE